MLVEQLTGSLSAELIRRLFLRCVILAGALALAGCQTSDYEAYQASYAAEASAREQRDMALHDPAAYTAFYDQTAREMAARNNAATAAAPGSEPEPVVAEPAAYDQAAYERAAYEQAAANERAQAEAYEQAMRNAQLLRAVNAMAGAYDQQRYEEQANYYYRQQQYQQVQQNMQMQLLNDNLQKLRGQGY